MAGLMYAELSGLRACEEVRRLGVVARFEEGNKKRIWDKLPKSAALWIQDIRAFKMSTRWLFSRFRKATSDLIHHRGRAGSLGWRESPEAATSKELS